MTQRSSVTPMPAADLANDAAMGDDDFARRLRGFGPVGLLAIIIIYFGNAIIEPLSALLVLLWAWRSRTPWRDIGFSKPPSWLLAIAGGILFGIAFKLIMKAGVMPLLGAPPTNQAFSHLVGNTAALPSAIFLMVVSAGFGEETVYRGFFFDRLGRLLGANAAATAFIVIATSLSFGFDHVANQGVPGFTQAALVGLVFGGIYAVTRRLWMLICAHSAFNLTALGIIYLDLEVDVATALYG